MGELILELPIFSSLMICSRIDSSGLAVLFDLAEEGTFLAVPGEDKNGLLDEGACDRRIVERGDGPGPARKLRTARSASIGAGILRLFETHY